MKFLFFNFKYASRSLRRGGQRSFFALLCVAVGVAAIVALQSTGLAIQGAVAGDARGQARSDVLVTNRQGLFNLQDLESFERLKHNKTLEDYTILAKLNLQIPKASGQTSNSFGSSYPIFVVEPEHYPFYGKEELASPSGKNFQAVLAQPNQLIPSQKMAEALGVKVGDRVKVSHENVSVELEVGGILTSKATTPPVTSSQEADMTGYAYLSRQTALANFRAEELLPDTVFVKTSNQPGEDEKTREAIQNLSASFVAKTSSERNEQFKQSFNGIKDLLTYVGLLSLLIGSVGVVNTMLVVVGRRSSEIATIKALGMESGQTVRMFVTEAAILGLAGSLIGVILGEALSLATSRAAESFINQTVEYHFYWSPVAIGLVVGIVTAIVFGLLPAYSASRIPPALVLRQKTNALPKISFQATLGLILVMTLVMGLLSGVILEGKYNLGVTVAFATLVTCALLVLVNSGLLWLMGKLGLPFGLSYKLARRNLSRSRAKNATTMLVMMVGIFSVSVVIILAGSLKSTIQATLEQSIGYNLQATSRDDTQTRAFVQNLEAKRLAAQEKFVRSSMASVRLVSAGRASFEELLKRKTSPADQNGMDSMAGAEFSSLLGVESQDLPGLAKKLEGEYFTGPDQVIISKELRDGYGLKPGDKLVFDDLNGANQFSLTISGIYESKNLVAGTSSLITTLERVENLAGHQGQISIKVENGKVDEALSYIEKNYPAITARDLSYLSATFNKLLDNVTAFPVLLAFLSLIAGAVLIANNVTLAVLERRTEMGVMKSIGADRGRVLSIITVESLIVSLFGAVIGFVLATSVASVLVSTFGTAEQPGVLEVSPLVFLGMLALAGGLSLLATLGSAWSAVKEKPMVVLRYE